MSVAIIVLLSVLVCFSIVNIILLFIYKKDIKTNWGFIVFILLFLMLIGITYFDIKLRLESDFKDLRTLVTLMTVLIASVSFITTVFLSNKTSKINKENQKSNFLIGLMKNHYDLMNGQKDHIDNLLNDLNQEFKEKKYVFDKLVRAFDDNFRGRTKELEVEVKKVSDFFGEQSNLDKINIKEKGKVITALKSLNLINQTKSDDIKRILVSYFHGTSNNPDFYKKLNKSEKDKIYPEVLINYLNESTNFFRIIEEFLLDKENILDAALNYEEINAACNKIFDDKYAEVGHFFRNSYRIVKLINLYYKDDLELRKNYLGILRSQYSENVILAIYYNCIFTDKGLGYANQLIGTDFFGDKKDLAYDKPIHFRTDELIFKDRDLKTIKKLFTEESEFIKTSNKEGFISKLFDKEDMEEDFDILKKNIKLSFDVS